MFFKKKSLSRSDRESLLAKIKERYADLGEHQSKSTITLNEFYDRYEEVIQSSMNEGVFLREELENIESFVKNLIKKKEKGKAGSASGTMEKIVQQMASKYKSYRRIKIGKGAPEEIEYLLGALVEFFEKYYSPFRFISRKVLHREVGSKFNGFDYDFQVLCDPTRQGLPKRFDDYKHEIEKDSSLDDRQRLAQPLLKETFNLMMKILEWVNFLSREVEHVRRLSYNVRGESYSFDELFAELKEDVDKVLDGFRLKGFI